uniref:I78 family peptidase inhibitor n=1 Tax=Altererythrobacter segetis TaxID=1104773 RepID=UPI00140A30B9|nr:I78 family peptidase inhibitor [Altererythrobacter segetis]
MRRVSSPAIAALLASCAATTPPAGETPPARDVKGTCQREPGQRFIGMKASGALGREMLAATGATVLRWVPPRTAVTMDFSPSRLTVSFDDDLVVTKVSCT